jgi:hypothetical protein
MSKAKPSVFLQPFYSDKPPYEQQGVDAFIGHQWIGSRRTAEQARAWADYMLAKLHGQPAPTEKEPS